MKQSLCRVCGHEVANWDDVIAAVQREYTYSREELEISGVHVRHWDCAVGEGRYSAEEATEIQAETGDAFDWTPLA